MKDGKIKYKYKAIFMESLLHFKELGSLHRGAIKRLEILKAASLQRQASKNSQDVDSRIAEQCKTECLGESPPILKLLGGGSVTAPAKQSSASHITICDAPGKEGERGLRIQTDCVPRIEKFYKQVVCLDLLLQCPLQSIMELSPPKKIVLNSSSKKIVQDKKELLVGLSACLMISGQKCQATWARRSIAGFKLREGSVTGCKVTLRGSSMYAFIDKLINLVLPRARPSLINQAIDPDGNYNIGISDPFLFVELEHHYDLFQSLQGIDVALLMSPSLKPLPPLFWSGLQILTE